MVGTGIDMMTGPPVAAARPPARRAWVPFGILLFAALLAAACAGGGKSVIGAPSTSTTGASTSGAASTDTGETTTTGTEVTGGTRATNTTGTITTGAKPPETRPTGGTSQETVTTTKHDSNDRNKRRKVGTILNVDEPTALVDDDEVSDHSPIGAGSVLKTLSRGLVWFQLDHKFDKCHLDPRSSVHVEPSQGTTMHLDEGILACGTNNQPDLCKLEAPGSIFGLRDPVFVIDASNDQATLQVVRGFVEARSAVAGAQGRLVGPRAAYTVPKDRQAGSARDFETSELSKVDQEAVREMMAALPQPNFALPPSQGSPGLTRIEKGQPLRVLLDDKDDAARKEFITKFLGFVANEWGVTLDVRVRARYAVGLNDSPVMEREERLGRDVDLAVSSGDLNQETQSMPFFDDSTQRKWSLFADGADPAFAAAVQDFLVNALDIGEYRDRYVAAFGFQPTYEAVRPLVLG